MVYNFFDKKSKGRGINIEEKPNKELTEELHKPIIMKFKKEQFIQDLKAMFGIKTIIADMQLISKFNKGFRFLLRVIDVFSKYVWVVPLKDKKGVTITNAFQKILKESDRKPNKIWVDKGSKFYNSSFKKWLKDNNIKMYSTHKD